MAEKNAGELRRRTGLQELVDQIATQFVKAGPGAEDSAIEEALRLIAEFTGAGIARVYVRDPKQGIAYVAHAWYAPDEPQFPFETRSLSLDEYDRYAEKLREHKDLVIRDLSEVPAAASGVRAWFTQHGFRASRTVPIVVDGELVGALTLHARPGKAHDWCNEDVPILHFVATIIGHVRARADAERRRARSEQRWKLLIEQSPLSIEVYDRDGLQIESNPAWARLWGVDDARQFVGHFNLLQDPEAQRRGYDAHFRHALAGETVMLHGIPFDPAGSGLPGRRRWINCLLFPLQTDSDEVENVVVVQQDVTEERITAESLEVFRRFAEASTQGCGWSTFDGHIAYANQALAALLGAEKPADVLGRPFMDFHRGSAETKLKTEVDPSVLQTGSWIGELDIWHPNGNIVAVLAHMFVVNDRDGSPLCLGCMFTDLSERKRAEAEKARLEAQIQHAQKLESLGVLAGGIAHDFNNLLCGILGGGELALRLLHQSHPAREHLVTISQTAQRAAELCGQMLAYSGRGRFVVEAVDLSRVVEGMAHLIRVSVSKKAALHYHLAENLPAVEADVTQVRQVLMNLVINASEALGDRNGVITVSSGVLHCDHGYLSETFGGEQLPRGRYVFLEVSDTGEGMSADTRARIFDPFFTTKFTGRGLGLAATSGIVRGHRGAIRVYSEPGAGSSFKLLLPPSDRQPRAATPLPEAPTWKGTGLVLLVDDEPMVRQVGQAMLEQLGFEVVAAEDGPTGLARFEERPDEFVLALVDMTMPGLDGEELFGKLRRIHPSVPVLLMSGYNEQDATSRFAGKGLAGFVAKPFSLKTLTHEVREAMARC